MDLFRRLIGVGLVRPVIPRSESTHGDTIRTDFNQEGVGWHSSPYERQPINSGSRTRP